MYLPQDAARTEIIRTLTEAGQKQHAPDELRRDIELLSSSSPDPYIRGYACWARDQLNPRPAAQAQTYHLAIEHPQAADTNPGDKNKPWKSISKAAETMRAGDSVIIYGGEYRECVRPVCGGTSYDAMITYQAADGEPVIIKAMDAWTPLWRDESGGCWSAAYVPHKWDTPTSSEDSNPGGRCEQIFANGTLLTHFKKKDDFVNNTNSMWIDNKHTRVWIRLAGGASPADCEIERSMRQQCFSPIVRGIGYVRVRGLTMIGGAAPIWSGGSWNHINQKAVLAIEGGHHWIIEDNTILYGNAQGLSIAVGGFAKTVREFPIVYRPLEKNDEPSEPGTSGGTIARRNKVNYHGISGIVGIGDAFDLVIEDNEVIGNDRKNNRGTCEEAGMKFHVMRNGIIRRNLVKDNYSHGIWIDCNCASNRITQNILIDNLDNQVFHEISPGPILIDNNVIMETRPNPTSTGFYTHDGNGATFINNAVIGCRLGVRVRALFHRQYHGKPTTTNHNHIFNNLFDGCRDGAVCLMPEVDRCEDNRSDANILWSRGAPVSLRIENTSDVGMKWEETELGKALDFCGGGDRMIPLDSWAAFLGMDTTSITLPPRLLVDTNDPAELRSSLVKLALANGLDLESGCYNAQPFDAAQFLTLAQDLPASSQPIRTVFTEPDCGLQIWQSGDAYQQVRWQGEAVQAPVQLREPLLIHDPIPAPVHASTLAVGDTTELKIGKDWRIVSSGLKAQISSRMLKISASANKKPGLYAVICARGEDWTLLPVTVAPACTLDTVCEMRNDETNCVEITLTNNSGNDIKGEIAVDLCEEQTRAPCSLTAHETAAFALPVACTSAGEANVTATLGATVLEATKLVSFAVARRDAGWEATTKYDMDSFPGGLWPDGAWAMVFYMGRLHAGWRARYDERGLHVRIEVEHPIHIARRLDMEGIHTGDGVKIGLKGKPGDRATVIGMALLHETHEQTYGFCKSGNEALYPIGRYMDMEAAVVRHGNLTTYDALITWDMINLDGPPPPGSSIPFSIFVPCKDEDAKYGLQWFFGILYDEREGDENWMGRLWFE
ncbi:MAG: hypothetical protein GF398_14655 [Chitinivibrionales bacterium]|nr:hypothetical protein [Chitinivibrionales bacterium]